MLTSTVGKLLTRIWHRYADDIVCFRGTRDIYTTSQTKLTNMYKIEVIIEKETCIKMNFSDLTSLDVNNQLSSSPGGPRAFTIPLVVADLQNELNIIVCIGIVNKFIAL